MLAKGKFGVVAEEENGIMREVSFCFVSCLFRMEEITVFYVLVEKK